MPTHLFITCLIDSFFPEVGEAVVTVLEQLGQDVTFPIDQTCCGQPAYNAGFHDDARRMAKHTIEIFSAVDGPIVIPSGSCTAMIRHGYVELFTDDPYWYPQARALAERCYEFSEFIVDVLGFTDVGVTYPGCLAYHPSCHLLRGLGIDRQPEALLKAVAGMELKRLEPDCCGFGGMFAFDHEPISSEMLARRLNQIYESGSEVVVACDVGCLMHIEGGLRKAGSRVRCAHIAQVLAGRETGLR